MHLDRQMDLFDRGGSSPSDLLLNLACRVFPLSVGMKELANPCHVTMFVGVGLLPVADGKKLRGSQRSTGCRRPATAASFERVMCSVDRPR